MHDNVSYRKQQQSDGDDEEIKTTSSTPVRNNASDNFKFSTFFQFSLAYESITTKEALENTYS